MRYTLGTLGAAALLAVGCAAATTGVAHADSDQPRRLYAPSALVLTIGKGEKAETAAIQRAVLLSCAPKPTGTHPAAGKACAELRAVNGEFQKLAEEDGPGRLCTRIWDPVIVTADGVWEGRRVSWSHTFGNRCLMEGGARGTVFSF